MSQRFVKHGTHENLQGRSDSIHDHPLHDDDDFDDPNAILLNTFGGGDDVTPRVRQSAPSSTPQLTNEDASGAQRAIVVPLSSAPQHRQSYRADVDGLRAVAVVAVLIFHFYPDALPGGFVGVDVFFVISGFLISNIIRRQHHGKGFTLWGFYDKRIRRILPMLLMVLVAVEFCAIAYLPSQALQQLGSMVAWSSAFLANVHLWWESVHAADEGDTYFAMTNVRYPMDANPLLHLWSLGVEEQFYIVWPLMLVALLNASSKTTAVVCGGGIFLMSFIINIALRNHQAADFYLVFSRFWELLMGAALVFAPRPPRVVAEVMAVGGLILIVLAIVYLRGDMYYPAYAALLPTLGTASVIAAGPGAIANTFVLGNNPMTWVGRLSYPLYMWHWPVLVFGTILTGDRSTDRSPWASKCDNSDVWSQMKPLMILLSIALARVTEPVEVILRHCKHPKTPLYLLGALGVVATFGVCMAVGAVPALMQHPPLPAAPLATTYPSLVDGSVLPLRECVDRVTVGTIKAGLVNPMHLTSEFHDGNRDHTVVFWGDSHMAVLLPRLRKIIAGKFPDLPTIAAYINPGCPPLPSAMGEFEHASICSNQFAMEVENRLAQDASVKTLVMTSFLEMWLHTVVRVMGQPMTWPTTPEAIANTSAWPPVVARFVATWQKWIQGHVDRGLDVYVIAPYYTYHSLAVPSRCVFGPEKVLAGLVPGDAFRLVNHVAAYVQPGNMTAYYNAIGFLADPILEAAARAGATILDPSTTLCYNQSCPLIDPNGFGVYKDHNHLAANYAAHYATFLDVTLNMSSTGSDATSGYCL
eukprot:m.39944 g.39944  ORF g.39944 m.39944 type:complete len:811 (-) comp14776_c0_seq1:76-2508(-)